MSTGLKWLFWKLIGTIHSNYRSTLALLTKNQVVLIKYVFRLKQFFRLFVRFTVVCYCWKKTNGKTTKLPLSKLNQDLKGVWQIITEIK